VRKRDAFTAENVPPSHERPLFLYQRNHGRRNNFKVKSLLLALLYPLTLLGYNTFAPILNIISPDGSVGSISFRGGVLILSLMMAFRYHLRSSRHCLQLLFPMYLFLCLYILRLIDNYYIQELYMYAPEAVTFGILVGSGLLPAIIIVGAIPRMTERDFFTANVIMLCVFLLGMVLNFDMVLEMMRARTNETMLFKLNAIELSSGAASYAVLLIVMAKTRLIGNVLRVGAALILLGIVAVTRSRGPLLATMLTLGIYFYFAAGEYKKYMIWTTFVLATAILIVSAYSGINFINIAAERIVENYDTFDVAAGNYAEAGLGRMDSWISAWYQFLESPLIGDMVYVSNFQLYPHNLIMESLISLGTIGTVLLLMHLYIGSKASVKLLRGDNSSLIERFSALVFFKALIEAQFTGAIWFQTTLWIASGCVISLAVARTDAARRTTVTIAMSSAMASGSYGGSESLPIADGPGRRCQ
jgi:O-antigen ligase